VITVLVPSHVGPGYLIHWSGLAGPVPSSDLFSASVILEGGVGSFLTSFQVSTRGLTFGQAVLGTTDDLTALAPGLDNYVPPGTLVQLEWHQYHSNFAVVDSGTVHGLVWEPVYGVFQLVQRLVNGDATGATGTILAAVRKTY
jgi:hypothetical protein